MAEDTNTAIRTDSERKDRVLIVEDEDNARKGYEQLLQKWGYDVLGVATAEDALAKFGSFQPDSLIADVELPGMNGLDLLKQLGTELRNVPSIIITGKGAHGAQPQQSIDPVVVACQLGTALQSIVSRNISAQDTVVLSITRIQSGDAYNVIPQQAVMAGMAVATVAVSSAARRRAFIDPLSALGRRCFGVCSGRQ